MKFLVIGASGFIGKHTLNYIKSRGFDVIGTRSGISKTNVPGLIPFNLMNQRIGDCVDKAFFETQDTVYAIICAAVSQTDRCLREKETSHKINVENTILLINDLVALGVKPVYVTTASVFDGKDGYYSEDHPHSPLSEYGRQKAKMEDYLSENVPEALVVRLDKIVGNNPDEKHIFSEWYEFIEEKRPILCIEDQLFSPTLVDDVAEAIVTSCEKNLSGLYNISNREFFKRDELARQFMYYLGKESKIVCKPQSELNFLDLRPPKSYLDTTKFVTATGMNFTSMRKVIDTFIEKVKTQTRIEEPSVMRRNACRLCNSENLRLVVKLVPTPVGDSYVPIEKLHVIQEEFPLELFLCENCGATQLIDVVNPEILYGNYIYETSISLGLSEHFSSYVEDVLKFVQPSKGSLVVDIGSNDGTLLRSFREKGLKVLGIDPAPEAVHKAEMAGIETISTYFSVELAKKIRKKYGPAAIITANNVMANVDNLDDMMEGLKALLADDGCYVFETGYCIDLVQERLIDTIYHEHISYFNVKPLVKFFNRCGMEMIHAEHISTKGGSFRGIVQLKGARRKVSAGVQQMIEKEDQAKIDCAETFDDLAQYIESAKGDLTPLLKDLKKKGKTIAGYGASVGVTTLIYLFGLAELLNFVVDDNMSRQNLFTPGFHIPVFPSDALYEKKPDYVLILAWRYREPILMKHQNFLKGGGHFIVPLPQLEIISPDEAHKVLEESNKQFA